jgi:hypothetical protein
MSDRGKYEGEHELQLQLLEATRGTNFTPYKPRIQGGVKVIIERQRSAGTASQTRAAKTLH